MSLHTMLLPTKPTLTILTTYHAKLGTFDVITILTMQTLYYCLPTYLANHFHCLDKNSWDI